jgi:hypothetical protein
VRGGDRGVANLAGAQQRRFVDGEIAEARRFAETDERAPDHRDEHRRRHGRALARRRFGGDDDGDEQRRLERAALAVEIRHVVLHLEELERDRLQARKAHQARPDLEEQHARLAHEVEPEQQRIAQARLGVAKDGVDQVLLALEAPIDRRHSDAGRRRDLRNRRSVKTALGKCSQRRLDDLLARLVVRALS